MAQLEYNENPQRLYCAVNTFTAYSVINAQDIKINYALQKIGEFYHLDKSYIFLFLDDKVTVDNYYEWCANCTTPHIFKPKIIGPL